MKKLFKRIIDKNKSAYRNHPVLYNIVLIVLETIMALWSGLGLAFGDVEAHPVWAILDFLLVIYWGGFICHALDNIIGRHDWWHLDITNPQIISLIHSLADAQKDIEDGKIAWIGNFYDPSKERIEATRVPIEEYLVDPQPTVGEKAPE